MTTTWWLFVRVCSRVVRTRLLTPDMTLMGRGNRGKKRKEGVRGGRLSSTIRPGIFGFQVGGRFAVLLDPSSYAWGRWWLGNRRPLGRWGSAGGFLLGDGWKRRASSSGAATVGLPLPICYSSFMPLGKKAHTNQIWFVLYFEICNLITSGKFFS